MKRFFIVCILLVASVVNAQWLVQPFESTAADSFFNHPIQGNLRGLGTGGSYAVLTDDPVAHQGSKSLKVEWHVNTTESWGGFVQLMHLTPTSDTTKPYFDFSMADHISIWYNNLTASSQPNFVHMRFKIHEAGGEANYWAAATDHEDWYFETAVPYDATPGWKELIIPLKTIEGFDGAAPNADGFSLPGWSGARNNGELDLDKVIGYSIEFTAPAIGGDNWAHGVVLWDDLRLVGSKYTPLETFDNTAATAGYYSIDAMSWGSTKGKITLTDVTQNQFEGASALQIEYTVNANQGWGGYANLTHEFATPMNLAANKSLYIAIKNPVANDLKGRLQCRLVLFDDGGSKRESWFTLFNFNIDSSITEWTTIKIPLEYSNVSSWSLAPNIFINPPDQGNDDGIMDLSKCGGFKIEYSVDANGPTGDNILSNGTTLFDFLIPAGFQETDKTAPVAPTGVAVIPGTYTNLITWTDVAGESTEKYNIYYSTSPITNVDAPGVEVVKLNVPEGIQVQDHVLKTAKTDQSLTYYYAVTCKDKAGNIGQPGSTSSAVTNMGKGVPTISVKAPTNFKADGDLSEWASFTPIVMKTSDGSGQIAPNTFIDNDNDLSVTAYVAIEGEYLYIAFNVNDDVVNHSSQTASYLNDAPDIFLGLYNFHGAPHTGYQRGAQPDYHLRFNILAVRSEGGADIDTLLAPGANYYWAEKFPSGYIVEAKISLNDLMNKRNSATAAKDIIYLKEGFRIPIDFSINDNDTGNRDGIMTYSPENRDLSYADVSRWTYTWLGDRMTPITGVEETLPFSYSLEQNYPNPFNPVTQIKYSISKAGHVSVKVFDILGRMVIELVNKQQEPGSYNVDFNASNLASGIYFYRIESGSFINVKKMVLIK
jgi:hypothetical protein